MRICRKAPLQLRITCGVRTMSTEMVAEENIRVPQVTAVLNDVDVELVRERVTLTEVSALRNTHRAPIRVSAGAEALDTSPPA